MAISLSASLAGPSTWLHWGRFEILVEYINHCPTERRFGGNAGNKDSNNCLKKKKLFRSFIPPVFSFLERGYELKDLYGILLYPEYVWKPYNLSSKPWHFWAKEVAKNSYSYIIFEIFIYWRANCFN